MSASFSNQRPFQIVDLNYVSVYVRDFQAAISFYSRVFGPPDDIGGDNEIYGWRMGATWLTVFPSKVGSSPESNPRNAEFAVQVSTTAEVDVLYQMLIEAGARECMAPKDTRMYVPMRFSCVDDPFGIRIDVYCPTTS